MTFDLYTFEGHKGVNRAHLIVCIRSEQRKQNMTFHKLPDSSDNSILTYLD